MTSGGHKDGAPLKGLVLAGGKSVRMGLDKSRIAWHGREQRYHLADLLRSACREVFISCRADQQQEIALGYNVIPDSYPVKGPYGAILSAMACDRKAAWLIVACDLPLLDEPTISFLTSKRDTSRMATTFRSPFDGFPEPLITIWEPQAFGPLEQFLAEGLTCPRKVLIRSAEEVLLLDPERPEALMNANTPEDAQKVRDLIDTGF